jgi:hypothetical protein
MTHFIPNKMDLRYRVYLTHDHRVQLGTYLKGYEFTLVQYGQILVIRDDQGHELYDFHTLLRENKLFYEPVDAAKYESPLSLATTR